MLRQIRNYRFNPFTATNTFTVITDEVHAIPSSSPYWVRLHEVPDQSYTDPTSGTPVYIRNADGMVFTEVSGSPGLNEFRVDYTYKTGWVEFNSGNAGEIILVCYRGTGSPVEAEIVNALQWFQPATPIFGGDGSDGDVTISADTALAENPAGSGIALKQYTNLTIATGVTLSLASGVHGMVLAVQGRLKLEANAVIDVAGRGASGGPGADSDGARGGCGAFGGGGGGGGYSTTGGNGGGDAPLFAPGAGQGGSGGSSGVNGSNGSKLIIADDLYWRILSNILVYGAGGGAGGGPYGGSGGSGGGFVIINCNVLELASGVSFQAKGSNGANSGHQNGAGGGGGAGGIILILANRVIGGTAPNVQSTNCDVSGGSGGSGYSNGGAGADGYKKVVELYEYNKF